MYKYKNISSTELKQKTRQILNSVVAEPDEAKIIYTYGEPKAVLLNYNKWEEDIGKRTTNTKDPKPISLWDKVKPYTLKNGAKIDSTKLIREMRDAE